MASGDGLFNPNVHDIEDNEFQWARKTRVKGDDDPCLVPYFQSWGSEVTLPVPAGFIQDDCEANTYFAMAIAMEHLVAVGSDPRWQEVLRETVRRNPKVDEETLLLSTLFAVYHNGRRWMEDRYDLNNVEGVYSMGVWPPLVTAIKFDKEERWKQKEYKGPGLIEGSKDKTFYYLLPAKKREGMLEKAEELNEKYPDVAEALGEYKEKALIKGEPEGKENLVRTGAKLSWKVLNNPELWQLFTQEISSMAKDEKVGQRLTKNLGLLPGFLGEFSKEEGGWEGLMEEISSEENKPEGRSQKQALVFLHDLFPEALHGVLKIQFSAGPKGRYPPIDLKRFNNRLGKCFWWGVDLQNLLREY